MSTFKVPLLLHVQAKDANEARAIQEQASVLVATDPNLFGDVLSIEAPTPREDV